MINRILVSVALLAVFAIAPAMAHDWSRSNQIRAEYERLNPPGRCLKNIDGECMELAAVEPYWAPHANPEPFGPHCTRQCMPGFVSVYGQSEQTIKEIAAGKIDWDRLAREQRGADVSGITGGRGR